MLQIGSLLDGKYKILNEIGHGGMSTVYLALNERANKTWAVKEVRKDGGTDSEVVRQGLIAETEMLKKLSNPHLPSIIDVIDMDDSFIIVMDYIQGKDLQKILDSEREKNPARNGALDPEAVKAWGIQLCEVLSYLHNQKPPIIYRDLKPANIMLQDEQSDSFPYGSVSVIDFGTAREHKEHASGDTVWLGTKGYAAPEQFGGMGETDARTDIYNLGATMYHLLTGLSPAEINFDFVPLGRYRPELQDSGIERIIAKCTQAAREDRYQNAEELKFDLEHEGEIGRSGVRKHKIRLYSFLASVIVALAAAASMAGFLFARNSTRASSYEAYVSRARNAGSVAEGQADYGSAIGLDPGKPDAYEALVNAIDADNYFDAGERKILENCLNSTTGGRRQSNADMLKDANPVDYDQLMYHVGTDYFFYYENDDGYKYAAQKLGNIQDVDNLDAGKNEIAIRDSLYLIADFCSRQKQNNGDESWIANNNAADLWSGITAFTAAPDQAISRCGTKRIAIAMYRELAKQIMQSADVYKNADITQDMMREAIASARTFMDRYSQGSGDSDYDRVLIGKANQAIDSAEFRVDNLFHELGTEYGKGQ